MQTENFYGIMRVNLAKQRKNVRVCVFIGECPGPNEDPICQNYSCMLWYYQRCSVATSGTYLPGGTEQSYRSVW